MAANPLNNQGMQVRLCTEGFYGRSNSKTSAQFPLLWLPCRFGAHADGSARGAIWVALCQENVQRLHGYQADGPPAGADVSRRNRPARAANRNFSTDGPQWQTDTAFDLNLG